jgi:hypothetical protein
MALNSLCKADTKDRESEDGLAKGNDGNEDEENPHRGGTG